jgi:hypothetical protein
MGQESMERLGQASAQFNRPHHLMKKVRLSPDYFCSPIWHDDGETSGEYGDIDPHQLPISRKLAEETMTWAAWFEAGLDMNDPGNSKGMTVEEQMAFLAEGGRLLERLRLELGPDFDVRKGPFF